MVAYKYRYHRGNILHYTSYEEPPPIYLVRVASILLQDTRNGLLAMVTSALPDIISKLPATAPSMVGTENVPPLSVATNVPPLVVMAAEALAFISATDNVIGIENSQLILDGFPLSRWLNDCWRCYLTYWHSIMENKRSKSQHDSNYGNGSGNINGRLRCLPFKVRFGLTQHS